MKLILLERKGVLWDWNKLTADLKSQNYNIENESYAEDLQMYSIGYFDELIAYS